MSETKTLTKTATAVRLMRRAARDDLIAAKLDGAACLSRRLTAQLAREQAVDLMAASLPPMLAHGEVVNQDAPPAIRDTLANPDGPALDASRARADLLLMESLDVSGLALDAANSMEAGNSLEKMLAHQLALAHASSFKLADQAMNQRDTVEQVRLMNAAARMMGTFQQGMLTLQRLRSGGNQTMTVQHVHIGEGAQAVIGNVQAGGRGDAEK